MQVELLTSTSSLFEMERNAALAALTCRGNAEKEHVPSEILTRIIKAGHESVLEHITLTYSVKGISRALLQELSRHRHISLSVESTRHTLRKQLNEQQVLSTADIERHGRFGEMLLLLKRIADDYPELSNDELKYYLPEFWPTNLVLTVNIRELRHILKLRTAPAALKEFRELGHVLYDAVPEEYRYLLKDCVHEEAAMSEFTPKSERLGRLIASAPEMYELLEVWTHRQAQPDLSIEQERARALLARIDGEQEGTDD